MQSAPAGGIGDVGKNLNLPNHISRAEGRPFPLPSVGWVPVLTVHHTQTAAIALHSTTATDRPHCDRSRFDRATNSPSDCGARPVQSCAGRLVDGCGDCGGFGAGAAVWG